MTEDEYDVVVVGFGAAGACAAIEAARSGASVLVLDRFAGGGATALSGGVVYAGGGTKQQKEAGVKDDPDAMFRYLAREVGDAVTPSTLRGFCENSADMVEWLEGNDVPFEGSLCPSKTSYPSNEFYLYYSGSEASGEFREVAEPAPRGHRAKGRGNSGQVLFAGLAASARAEGVRVMAQARAERLIADEDGRVVGVEAMSLRNAPARIRRRHRRLSGLAAKPGLYVPALRKRLTRQVEAIERRYARPVTVAARRGVVLSAGGFVANREMLREHAPAYRGGLALGTAGDDGSGIHMGLDAGGVANRLGRVSAWRFITPPSAFISGVVVNAAGARIIDESRYGAAIGDVLINHHEGRGWLLVDEGLVAEARRDLRKATQWFQYLQVRFLLARGRVTGATVADVARKAGVDPSGLSATVAEYNAAADDPEGKTDPLGKPSEFTRPLAQPPYSLIDISVRPNVGYPCPMLTLGGLVVDERTGAVLDADGAFVPGLFAAGRTAVGICSNSYISGLSLADCVFSGRRAGKFSALVPPGVDRNENVF